MATRNTGKASRGQLCRRCGGFMVSDIYVDLLSGTSELDFAAKRCVQCGEVVDPVIQENRRKASIAVRFVETEAS